MRNPIVVVPLCAVMLAGCDSNVTGPADRAPSKAQPILFGSGWSRVDLPFSPRGMNDAGVIVGFKGGEAVRWENRTLTVLPHRAGVAGLYEALTITPNGMILS